MPCLKKRGGLTLQNECTLFLNDWSDTGCTQNTQDCHLFSSIYKQSENVTVKTTLTSSSSSAESLEIELVE